jgi:hypothetical protein
MFAESVGGGGSGPKGGPEFFNFPATRITGEKIDQLHDIVGDKKAILVVNVASE